MSRSGLLLPAALLLACSGCFSAQPGAEGYRERIGMDMGRDQVLAAIGEPKDAFPIPGQGETAGLPVEQWRYEWNYTTGKTLTIVGTLFVGLIWMDLHPYGFDVGFGRDGRVCIISDVVKRPR
jgi:hypothetical protein